MMTPGEISLRLRRLVRNRVWRHFPPRANASGTASRVTWFFDMRDREKVRAFARSQCHWNESTAEEYLQHRFSFFNLSKADFGPTIRWNRDYLNGLDTPLRFGPDIDYRNAAECGDIKYAWEHNRHHHLVEMAKAYYLTGKGVYADEVRAQIESWIDQCPYLQGVQWASSLESAIRVINWCFIYQFILAEGSGYLELHRDFLRRWNMSIHQHLVFISRNFSGYSSANNHRIGEASGLFIGALCFSSDESEAWLRAAATILEEEAARQIWPDGVDKEQATSYQAFVFDFLLIAALLGRRNGRDFTPRYWQSLEKMADFVSSLIDASGDVPKIGDEDDGHVVRLAHTQGFKPFRSLLGTAAVVFQRDDFARKAVHYDEKSFWLLGFQDFQVLLDREMERTPTLSFPSGGYYIVRANRSTLIMDCGPLGLLSLAAHGHADALSILLSYKNRWILVDPGTYAYHTHREWRDYFRGTAAHNTVRIDGLDQSVIGGNFMWLQKATAHLSRHDAFSVAGWHDGYRRLSSPVRHEREVVFEQAERTYRVIDRLRGEGTHRVELFFHLPPECSLAGQGRGFLLTNGPAAVVLQPDAQIGERNVLAGSVSPMGGWYSPGYDRKIPSTTIRLAMTARGGTELVTTLSLR
jgi:hypothetical protein